MTEQGLGRAMVPSGASTGSNEALELRDGGERYLGKGVEKAVENVNTEIAKVLIGFEITDQQSLDQAMIDLDGTDNKRRLGANAILGVSLASSRAGAEASAEPLYQYIAKLYDFPTDNYILPTPMMNVINGGAHADSGLDIQEFMLLPVGAKTFSEGLRMIAEIFHVLKKNLKAKALSVGVGDEGGFAPHIQTTNEVFQVLSQAIEDSGYRVQDDVVFALDAAASEFYIDGKYKYQAMELDADRMIEQWQDLSTKHRIVSIEDGLAEDDWEGWTQLQARLGESTQIVGDDLLVTNPKFLQRAIDEKSCNSILIKLNQIGTLTETIETIKMAHAAKMTTIISHRSGETEDPYIADLAVATGAGQIKTGSASRSDRMAKYNQLLRIEEALGDKGQYLGGQAFTRSV